MDERPSFGRARYAALIVWQLFLALVVGWFVFVVVWGAMVFLGRTAGSAAMFAMLLVGILLFAIGAFAAPGPASNGPRSAERWLARRLGTDPRALESRGLTFRAQALFAATMMLVVAGVSWA